jgi:hypothetical protein
MTVGMGPTGGLPLKVSSDGRYLTDQGGTPLLIVADSPQGMLVDCSLAEMDTYLANRAGKGFNAIQVHVIAGSSFGGRGDFSTYDSITPFTTPGDITTPRETYFARFDALINKAAALGIVVFANTGDWIDGSSLWTTAGAADCQTFGAFLGARYKDFRNIVWQLGNDFASNIPPTSGQDALLTGMATGIKAQDANHILTSWMWYYDSLSSDDTNWNTLADIDSAYTYYPTYVTVLAGRAHSPTKPVWFIEGNYEGENLRGYTTDDFHIRKQMWWALTSGACGHVYCNADIWKFVSGWASRLDSYAGCEDVQWLTALWNEWAGYTWVPDTTNVILTVGYDGAVGKVTSRESGSVDTNTYATTCANPTKSVVVSYIPTQRQVTIDMSQVSGSTARCRWYDPKAGGYTAIGTYACSGTRDFTPPSAQDWVLVIDKAS